MYSIGVIGAGRLGCALGIGLKSLGFQINGIYSKSDESHQYLTTKLNITSQNDLYFTIKESDIIFITVPDMEIANIVISISTLFKEQEIIQKKHFFHCSGFLSSKELDPLKALGASTGSLHPLQTFANKEDGWKSLFGICFAFDGGCQSKEIAEYIANRFEGQMFLVDEAQKTLYHVAACMVSNYCITLCAAASKILNSISLENKISPTAFIPLLERTVENIKILGASNALTGPILRGDYTTVNAHIQELDKKMPEMAEIYKSLGRCTLKIVKERKSLDDEKYDFLKNLLR